jgi:hypothetical protein
VTSAFPPPAQHAGDGGFATLPGEIHEEILSSLPPEDRARLGLTNTALRRAVGPVAEPPVHTVYRQDTLDVRLAEASPNDYHFRPAEHDVLVVRGPLRRGTVVHGPHRVRAAEAFDELRLSTDACVAEVRGGHVQMSGSARVHVVHSGQISATFSAFVDEVRAGGAILRGDAGVGQFLGSDLRLRNHSHAHVVTTAGDVIAENQAQIGAVTAVRQLLLRHSAVVGQFTGGTATCEGNSHVGEVHGGIMTISHHAVVDTVLSGQVTATGDARIHLVAGGVVQCWGNAVVEQVTGGEVFASDNVFVSASGGILYVDGTARLEVTGEVQVYGLAGPDAPAPDTVLITGPNGGPVPDTVHVHR